MRDVARCDLRHLRSNRFVGVVFVTILVASALLAPKLALAVKPHGVEAAEFLARRYGRPASDFAVVYERAEVSIAGEALWVGKLADRVTGSIEIVYRHLAGGLGGPDLPRGLRRAVDARLTAMERKASKALREAVSQAREGSADAAQPRDDLQVAVWLNADIASAEATVMSRHPEVAWVGGRPVAADLAHTRQLRAELWEARSQAFAAATAALEANVARLGGRVGYASTSAPIVFLDVPAASVERLAEDDAVVSMGLEGAWSPAMSAAGATVDANWTVGGDDLGSGIRVGVVEYHNVRATGDLAGRVAASWAVGGKLAYTGSGTFDHPTWVAGAVASQSGSYRGVAPAAVVVSAGTGGYTPSLTYDRRIIAATDWAASPLGGDADIINTSLVQDTAVGAEEARRFFDAISYLGGRLAVSAAGNYVNFNGWQVGSPGTGYNVLTVGGIDDRNTQSRADDRVWFVPGSNGSNYLERSSDPWNPHGDFNKPNLVAPAVGVRTANGLGASGTSIATPVVAGIAAQLLSNEPTLAVWPEAARAVVMAGAVHRVRMPDGSYNMDHEGVGMSSALWTARAGNQGDGTYGGYRLGALSAGDRVSQAISVRPGDRLRVALAWNSHATSATAADTLLSDLDVRVTTPNGVVVGSYSLDNAYEFVEVPISVGGTATVEILTTRFDADVERYGLAWAKVGDRTPPTARALLPQAGEPWALSSARPQVVFSEGVTGVSSSSLALRPAGGSSDLTATVSYSPSSRTATIRPAAVLAPGNYTVFVRTGIADPALNALAPTSWGFTVRAPSSGFDTTLSPARRIWFSPGTHVGFRFDGAGGVTATKAARLDRASSATVDRRATLPGMPGVWLRVRDGIWAAYWIRESAAARLAGEFSRQTLSPSALFSVRSGTQVGYQFDSAGRVVRTKPYTLGSSSAASASRRSVINGAWHLYVVNGIWAGYWLRESGNVYLPGARDLRDIGAGRLVLGSGSHTGRLFGADGRLIRITRSSLTTGSSVTASGWAVINGQPSFYVTSGPLTGYWILESSAAHLP